LRYVSIVLHCVAMYCTVLQCGRAQVSPYPTAGVLQCIAVCCSISLVCCAILHCVALCVWRVAVCCSALQCVAVRCSVRKDQQAKASH